MALEILSQTIEQWNSARTDIERMRIANKWFTRNAAATAEEMQKRLDEQET